MSAATQNEMERLRNATEKLERRVVELNNELTLANKRTQALLDEYRALDALVQKEYGQSFGKYSDFANAYDELPEPPVNLDSIKIT